MKLLTPKQVKKEKRKDLAKDLILAKKVEKVSNEKRAELNTIKTKFESKKDKLNEDFSTFLSKHNKNKTALVNEITTLEIRKKEAMVPVDELLIEAKNKNDLADIRDKELKVKHKSLEERNIELNNKERKIFNIEKKLTDFEKQLNLRQDTVSNAEVELLKDKQIMEIEKDKNSTLINSQKEEIVNSRATINVDKQILKNRELSIVKREKEVENEWVKIADARATLKRAFNRLKK